MANQTYEKITVAATAIGLTAAKYTTTATQTGKVRAVLTLETASIRWTVDGTTPVAATTGHLMETSDVLELESAEEIAGFRAIRESGTSGVLHVTYGV